MTAPISQQQLITGGSLASKFYIDDVFSQDLYRGDGSNTTDVTNGIDLSENAGLVISKCTNATIDWDFRDTLRGADKSLMSNDSETEQTTSGGFAFLNNGFNRGNRNTFNQNTENYLATTFRQSKGFFDVVTWTGNGVSGRAINHTLGCLPGMIWVKHTDGTTNWAVYHKNMTSSNPQNYYLRLNTTDTRIAASTIWNDTAPTETQFTVGDSTYVNQNGAQYVAYVFAGGEDAGSQIYGPDEDSEMIKCGTYTGNGGTQEVDIGWPASLIIIKSMSGNGTNSWGWFDPYIMKGEFTASGHGDGNSMKMNDNSAKSAFLRFMPSSKGIWIQSDGNYNQSGVEFVYMAIRQKGPKICKTAEDGAVGTDYFALDTGNNESYIPPGCFDSGNSFGVQLALTKEPYTFSDWFVSNRNHWTYHWITNLYTRGDNSMWVWNSTTGWARNQGTNLMSYMWRNGPGFMSFTFQGNGAAQTLNHNLGKTPEMVWIKNMNANDVSVMGHFGVNGGVDPWNYRQNMLDDGGFGLSVNQGFNNTAPTATQITIGSDAAVAGTNNNSNIQVNLFTSAEGICKCGWYTGDGTSDNSKAVTLGFQPRFVIIKNSGATADMIVIDSVHGFAKYLRLNKNNDIQNATRISVTATGFTLASSDAQVNTSGDNYIYYAHA